ncbi:hypothetical protein [Microcystis aeruginosa]|uniref:hypothetical protein n=1 Tax=Microcystis aeruginosa TaxID=1126 RepID=UPI00130511D2|nr:hypothetical protein [Microcystis aeruginosa]
MRQKVFRGGRVWGVGCGVWGVGIINKSCLLPSAFCLLPSLTGIGKWGNGGMGEWGNLTKTPKP